jgi:hypothetical protein
MNGALRGRLRANGFSVAILDDPGGRGQGTWNHRVTAVFKVIVWVGAMLVIWLTLWARRLAKT